jgi:hypothetical protein
MRLGQVKRHAMLRSPARDLLLRQGTVKGRKVGRIWLVDLDDLRRYEQEMKELGTKKFDPTKGE